MTQAELDEFPALAQWEMVAKISRMRRSELRRLHDTYGINECPYGCIPKLAPCKRHKNKPFCRCPVWGRQTPCQHVAERDWYLPSPIQIILYQLLWPEKYLGPGERPIMAPSKRQRRKPKTPPTPLPSDISRRIILNEDIRGIS